MQPSAGKISGAPFSSPIRHLASSSLSPRLLLGGVVDVPLMESCNLARYPTKQANKFGGPSRPSQKPLPWLPWQRKNNNNLKKVGEFEPKFTRSGHRLL